MAFYDLDGKTRRAIALEELVIAASLETMEHEEGCGWIFRRSGPLGEATAARPA